MARTIDVEGTHFLAIDLDVRSRRSLADLWTAWPQAYQPLRTERTRVCRWLILNPDAQFATAEQAARHLLRRAEALRGKARRSWRDAHRRTFDIGVQGSAAATSAPFEDVRLTTPTLKRIAAVGGQVQITIYPPTPSLVPTAAGTGTRTARPRTARTCRCYPRRAPIRTPVANRIPTANHSE